MDQGLRPLNTIDYASQRRPSPSLLRRTNRSRFSPVGTYGRVFTSHPYDDDKIDVESRRPLKKQKAGETAFVDLIGDSSESFDDLRVSQQTPLTQNFRRQSIKGNGTSSQSRQSMVPEYSALNVLVEVPKESPNRRPLATVDSNGEVPDSVESNEDDDVLVHAAPDQRKGRSNRDSPYKSLGETVKAPADGTKSRYFSTTDKSLSDRFVSADGKKRTTNISSDSSPDVLHASDTTVFRNGVKSSKSPAANGKMRRRRFPLKSILYGGFPHDYDDLVAELNLKTLDLHVLSGSELLSTAPLLEFSLKKAIRGCHEPDPRTVFLEFSKEGPKRNRLFLELVSEKDTIDLLHILQKISGFNLIPKKEGWVQQARARYHEESKRDSGSMERASPLPVARNERIYSVEIAKKPAEAHMRSAHTVVSSMQATERELSSSTRTTRPRQSQPSNSEDASLTRQVKRKLPSEEATVFERKTPTRTYGTRSGARSVTTIIDDDEKENPLLKSFRRVDLGPKWDNPLVYPKSGKNRAEVEFHDLERLQDHEMLNDNLIGFYLRYLQNYLEEARPEIADQIYFFNTFFFATLTASGKARRSINYEGVQKWTRRGVDIFTKKFVVVPINEATHWYVALICNLPALQRRINLEDDAEDPEENNTVISNLVSAQQENNLGPTVPGSETVEGPSEKMDIDSQHESNRPTVNNTSPESTQPTILDSMNDTNPGSITTPHSSTKKKAGSTAKKKVKNLPKYDPDEPVIITLDSLDMSRSTTVRTLKDYVSAEAKAKRAMNVDSTSIRGMSAKGIPTQTNYIDCGLYLLAYIEKLVLDPYRFVHEILQREMAEENWPKMESTELRKRLRSFILDLHKSQQDESDSKSLPAVGTILLGPLESRMPTPPKHSKPGPEAEVDISQLELLSHQHDIKTTSPSRKAPSRGKTQSPSDRLLIRGDDLIKPVKKNLQSGKVRGEPIVLDDDSPTKPIEKRRDHADPDFVSQLEAAARKDDSAIKLKSPPRASRHSSVDTNFLLNPKDDKSTPPPENDSTAPQGKEIEQEHEVDDEPDHSAVEDSIVVDSHIKPNDDPRDSMDISSVRVTTLLGEIPETQSEEEFEGMEQILDQPTQQNGAEIEPMAVDEAQKEDNDSSDIMLEV